MKASASTPRFRALVLYACSGSHGHRVLAENYCELMQSFGVDAVAVDVFEQEGRMRFNRWIVVYFWILKVTPRLWRGFYCFWSAVPGIDFFRRQLLPRRFRNTLRLLRSTNTDLVLSTHPVATAVADFLKQRNALFAPLWVAFSDWHTQSFWIFPNVEHYLVPVDGQLDTLKECGISAQNVSVVGMLLRTAYYEQKNTREAARLDLQISNDRKVILIMGGGKGWALEEIIEGVRHVAAQRVVIAGSKERKRELEEYITKGKYDGDWNILGWVDPIQYLIASDLVIAKPGGLSTAEALQLRKPLVLCQAMPGHEEENGRVLNEFGVCWASSIEQL